MEELKKNPDTDILHLSKCLKDKSGFSQFLDVLNTHFGDRSRVLKAQRSVVTLLDACNRDSQNVDLQKYQQIIDNVRRRITSIQDELHDLKEMDLLNSIYEGRLKIEDTSFMNELKAVCGENGDGICHRLCVSEQMSTEEMIIIAEERCMKWTRRYNALINISSQKAYPYTVVAKSYALIAKRLKKQLEEYKEALRTISIYNRYLYGRTNK